MSDVKTELAGLADRCERSPGPDRLIAAQIHTVVDGRPCVFNSKWDCWEGAGGFRVPDYTASLDAAMTLVPDGFGWWFSCGKVRPNGEPPEANESFAMVWQTVGDERFRAGDERHGKIANPALALCAAALRARAAQVDRNPEGHDPVEGHGAKHENPVAEGHAPEH